MTKTDWLEVGLKLLGAYFLVVGAVAVWRTTLALLFASGRGLGDASTGAIALLFPVAEILAGIVLIRLRWRLPDPTRRHTKPLPAYLEEQFEQLESGSESRSAEPGATADQPRD